MDTLETEKLESVGQCPVCSGGGMLLYEGLKDRLLEGASATWNFWQCTNCGLLWLNPRYAPPFIHLAYSGYSDHKWTYGRDLPSSPLKSVVKNAYYSYKYGYKIDMPIWQKLIGLLIALPHVVRARLDRYIAFLPAHPRGRLLDVGSGSGWFLQQMQRLGWQAEGLDVDAISAAKAHSRGVTVRVGTLALAGQTYTDNAFDAITITHVLEHVHDPLADLQICQRILKPGGTLVIITPNTNSHGHQVFGHNWLHLDPPRHLNLFNPHSLHLAVEKAGLRRVRMFTRVQDSRHIWFSSQAIGVTSHYRRGRPTDWTARLGSWRFALAEWAQMLFHPESGEEIVLIAQK